MQISSKLPKVLQQKIRDFEVTILDYKSLFFSHDRSGCPVGHACIFPKSWTDFIGSDQGRQLWRDKDKILADVQYNPSRIEPRLVLYLEQSGTRACWAIVIPLRSRYDAQLVAIETAIVQHILDAIQYEKTQLFSATFQQWHLNELACAIDQRHATPSYATCPACQAQVGNYKFLTVANVLTLSYYRREQVQHLREFILDKLQRCPATTSKRVLEPQPDLLVSNQVGKRTCDLSCVIL